MPAGKYRVEVVGSENSFTEAEQRIFDVAVVTTGTDPAAREVKQVIGTDVDLFKLASGAGKPYVIKGEVMHAGGPLKVGFFTAKVDFAKFSRPCASSDMQGNKVAWAFARKISPT